MSLKKETRILYGTMLILQTILSIFLYFKTSDAGNAYVFEEESIGGNISFMLKKSSEKQ